MITVKITAANVNTPAMRKLKLVKNGSIMFIKERFVVSVVSCTSMYCMGLGLPGLREHQAFSELQPKKPDALAFLAMVCHAKDTQGSAV